MCITDSVWFDYVTKQPDDPPRLVDRNVSLEAYAKPVHVTGVVVYIKECSYASGVCLYGKQFKECPVVQLAQRRREEKQWGDGDGP